MAAGKALAAVVVAVVLASGNGVGAAEQPTKRVAARPVVGELEAGVPYAALFRRAGREHGVSPVLLAAVAKTESDFNPRAIGPRTRTGERARGLMQIMPSTAAWLRVDPMVPAQAIDGAARLLASYQRRYRGDLDAMLTAYNAGPGRVDDYRRGVRYLPPETQLYIPSVRHHMRALRV